MHFTLKTLLVVCTVFISINVYAEKITIAAASDTKFAMDEIVANFRKINPGDQVDIIYGSSGKMHSQILQNAPYDLFFSADIDFAQRLVDKDMGGSEIKLYAIGRIVLWSNSRDARKMKLEDLVDPKIKHIAIANPKHAPYGQRAVEALRATGILEKVESKLVYGESIAHAAQFVQSGNAEIGIIAQSIALSNVFASRGGYFLIPESMHTPLKQGFIITKRASVNPLAKRFAEHIQLPASRKIMRQYGFSLPGETD